MNSFFKGIFLTILLLFSVNTFAASSETSCGVTSGGGSSGQAQIVDGSNFSICKEDLAFNAILMVFSRVFEEFPILKAFVSDSDGLSANADKGYALEVGGPITAILAGFTYMVFLASCIFIGWATIKYIYLTANSGEFNEGKAPLMVVVRAGLVIILICPFFSQSGFALVHVIVISLALLSLKLGNFLWGGFLNFVQVQSSEAQPISDGENKALALDFANNMVSAQVCEDRTVKATKSFFFPSFDDGLLRDLNFETQVRRVANCIDGATYYNGDDRGIFSYVFGNSKTCASINDGISVDVGGVSVGYSTASMSIINGYDPKFHGENYSCGSVSYARPNFDEIVESYAGQDNSGDVVGAITSATSVMTSSVNPSQQLSSIYSKVKSAISSGSTIDFENGFTAESAAIQSGIEEKAKSLFDTVKTQSDRNTAYKAVFMAYANTYANLMGGSGDGNGWGEVDASSNVGINAFNLYAKKASTALLQEHCLTNYYQLFDKTVGTVKALTAGGNEDFSDFLAKNPSISFECVDLLSNDKHPNSGGTAVGGSDSSISLTLPAGLVGELSTFKGDEAGVNKLDGYIQQYRPKLLEEAQASRMTIAAYSYALRKGMNDAFVATMKDTIDQELPLRMRKMGLASSGSYMLEIAMNQNNAQRFINNLNSLVTASGYQEAGGIGTYINTDVFDTQNNQNAEVLAERLKQVDFKVMRLQNFYTDSNNAAMVVASTKLSPYQETDTGYSIDGFLRTIEDWIFAPTSHLKKISGFDQNLSLREGAEKCYTEGDCKFTGVHPITSLSAMGHDLIDISINIILTKLVFAGLVKLIDVLTGDGAGDVKEGKIAGMIKTIAKAGLKVFGAVAIYAIKAIDIILGGLVVLCLPLFALGILYAYVVPITPFIMFLVAFIGWLLLVFEILIAVLIFLVMWGVPDDNGNARGNGTVLFNFTMQILLFPSLLVVGLILGWFVSSVSIFIVNLLIFGALAPMGEAVAGSFINKILNIIMFYIIYLGVIYIAIHHSFKIIRTFPDQVLQRINIQPTRSGQYDMGVEKMIQGYLGTQIVGQVMNTGKDMAAKTGDTIDQKIKQRKARKKEAMEDQLRGFSKDDVEKMVEEARAKANKNPNSALGVFDELASGINDLFKKKK